MTQKESIEGCGIRSLVITDGHVKEEVYAVLPPEMS